MSDRRLVLVTGGSSGIGKEIARRYLQEGARVVIVADREEKLRAAERELLAVSPHASAVPCDVDRPESVVALSEHVLARFGCPDVLVNNAGFATYRTFAETSPEEVERLVSVNLLGHLRCTRAFVPHMIRRRSGVIVNMASIGGRVALAPNGTYSAAKHGLVAWSETLRHELHQFGIAVVVVCPGRVPTGLFDHETFRARQPGLATRQVVSVEAVAHATIRGVARRQAMVYVPRHLSLLAWANDALPCLSRPLLGAWIRRRVAEIDDRRKGAPLTGAAVS